MKLEFNYKQKRDGMIANAVKVQSVKSPTTLTAVSFLYFGNWMSDFGNTHLNTDK